MGGWGAVGGWGGGGGRRRRRRRRRRNKIRRAIRNRTLHDAHVCGPNLRTTPPFESSRCAEPESGLRFPLCGVRNFSIFRPLLP
jgi:hypothetical protein